MNSEIILQIFSGGFRGNGVSFEEVEKKLVSVLPEMQVSKVIMGWSPNKLLYEKTAEFLAKRNIEFFLWFPVFSETGALKDQSPLVDIQGIELKSSNKTSHEDFSFCCPNNPQNIENIFAIFEEHFSPVPFTGIFLDKIRYPSLAQKGVFSCFCPHCLEEYEKENFDVKLLKNVISNFSSLPLGITGFSNSGKYEFKDDIISRFFSLKADFIHRCMRQICRYFSEKGLLIGMDVFAPFLSPFTGQDLQKLSGLCNFMKPMMYRLTNAPAGLPFETEVLLQETGCTNQEEKQIFYDILGLDSQQQVFDLEFAVKDLKALVSSSACPVYAGVEINRIENIAEVYPPYIEETMTAYAGTGTRGFVLSWDLLSAPEENIMQAGETVKKLSLR